MKVTIERIEDLFDQEVVDEMIGLVDDIGCCHYNSGMMCVEFEDWECIDYVEGYLGGVYGHAINVYTDEFGKRHYIDVTQEYYVRNGLKDKFDTSFDVVKTFSTEEIKDIFGRDGETHLVEVDIINTKAA